jgi:vacuolar protein sorting-associated protein 72
MADDVSMDDAPQLSDTDASDNELDGEPIESLVAGRERRKTAGNRYDKAALLEEAAEAVGVQEEDDVALLFADDEEEGEDEEFRSDAEEGDAEMSSSDDDDQGPNAAVDDLEGEKELEKQAKDARAKKRKADLALTSVAGMRKKLKTDPTRPGPKPPAPKPSKKKDRVTWVHDQDSGRSSLRKQTIAHRAETIARLKESEAQSKKLKALKEKRDREKAKDAPKELTQADRLAEAARIERQNAKSLNRWQAQEKKRQAEQAEKLTALKNRKLEGPVVTWLSQKVKWSGQKLVRTASRDATESTEPKKRGRKSKAELEAMAAEKEAALTITVQGPTATAQPTQAAPENAPAGATEPTGQAPTPQQPSGVVEQPLENQINPVTVEKALVPTTTVPLEEQNTFLKGIHEYANQPAESNAASSKVNTPGPSEDKMEVNQQVDAEPDPNTPASLPRATSESTPQPLGPDHLSTPTVIKSEVPVGPQDLPYRATQLSAIEPMIVEVTNTTEAPPVEEDSTRNVVILQDFEELSSNQRHEYSLFFNKKTARAARALKASQELCLITTLPVRYRDPITGIAYANSAAYRKVQDLKDHKYTWSSMLGCYVGFEGGIVARGVPDGFV